MMIGTSSPLAQKDSSELEELACAQTVTNHQRMQLCGLGQDYLLSFEVSSEG